jgi:predicted nucleic acid-binding Zn ribbon protein
MKKNNEVKLNDAISGMFRDFHLDEKMDESRLRENWEVWVGKTIARYTGNINLRGGVLHINTEVSALRQELLYLKPSLMQKLNEGLGRETIKDIQLH